MCPLIKAMGATLVMHCELQLGKEFKDNIDER